MQPINVDDSIVLEDCLEARNVFEHLCGKVTLAYLDPPFCTQRNFAQFRDIWTGIYTYSIWLRERLSVIKLMLAPHGTCVLHLDHHVSHYAKPVGDLVFGIDNFESEIIWRYRRWPSKTDNFQRVHDTLFRWNKCSDNEQRRWHQLYEPLAKSTLKQWGTRRQTAVMKDGKRVKSSTSQEESKGVPMGDVWDIPIIAPSSKERTGYPTQKPLVLMSRLVESLTDVGDIVFEPFCGSGSMCAAALKLGRIPIGMDISEEAVDITKKRLSRIYEESQRGQR